MGLPERLGNKRIVITGGSSGIGLATARMALADGAAEVILAARSPDRLNAATQDLGQRVRSVQLDVTDESAVASAFAEIGAFDHLVTAAAGTYRGRISETDIIGARSLFESKFWGQYNCLMHGGPRIQLGGSITLFSGWISRKPMSGTGMLAAVDGAIESLTRVAAIEFAPIRVNSVSPGQIETPLWLARFTDQEKRDYFKQHGKELLVGRSGNADDVAHAVHFLMTNGFTTGAIVDIDGGQR